MPTETIEDSKQIANMASTKEATSAAVAAGGGGEEPKRKRGRPKKLKGMPRRPLSAYNLFFKEERERIRALIAEGETPEDFTNSVNEALKRVQGKTSAAEFQAIASTIAKRWKSLPAEQRSKYEKQAESEMELYQEKKFAYHRALVRDCADAAKTSIRDAQDTGAPAHQLGPNAATAKLDPSQQLALGTWNLPVPMTTSLHPSLLNAAAAFPAQQRHVFLPSLGGGLIQPGVPPNSLLVGQQDPHAALSHALLLAEMQKRALRQDEPSAAAPSSHDLLRQYNSDIANLELRLLQKRQLLQQQQQQQPLMSQMSIVAPSAEAEQNLRAMLLRQSQAPAPTDSRSPAQPGI